MRLNTSTDLHDTAAQFWRLRDGLASIIAQIRHARDQAAMIRYYAALGADRLCDIGLSEGAVRKASSSRDPSASLVNDYRRERSEVPCH
ncbi:MAG: hypothetical protein AAF580_01975 [Pseudomonadota bacterium]